MNLVKISIIINLVLIMSFLFMILVKSFCYIKKLFNANALNRKETPKLIKDYFSTNYIIILIIILSIILSILRAVFVDPQIIVTDGYDYYANQIRLLLNDWSYDIDNHLIMPGTLGSEFLHKFRIVYSLSIAIIHMIFPKIKIILVGRIISLCSSLVSFILISKILKYFNFSKDKKNILKISIIFILNPTIITNLIRFETDMLFLAISLFVIYLYLKIIYEKRNFIDIVLLIISITLLFFTREVGVILIIAIVFHFILNQRAKVKISIFVITFVSIIILSIFGIFQALLYHTIWAATVKEIAYDIVYNLSFKSYYERFLSKMSNINTIIKTMESLVYAFLPSAIFGLLGFINLYNKTDNKRKLFLNLISIYFVLFFFVYIFVKVGRGLDRFWIPILLFPSFLLPHCDNLKTIGYKIKQRIRIIRNKIIQVISKTQINQTNEVNESNITNQNNSISIDIVLFTVIAQLLIYVIRFSLALFDLSIAG